MESSLEEAPETDQEEPLEDTKKTEVRGYFYLSSVFIQMKKLQGERHKVQISGSQSVSLKIDEKYVIRYFFFNWTYKNVTLDPRRESSLIDTCTADYNI